MKQMVWIMLASAFFMASCGNGSRRAEIDARKAALRHHQDSALAASQQQLSVVDSTLEVVKRQYDEMSARVDSHKAALKATAEELTALTLLRMRRDSLQVQFDVLCAKIKYIHKKQKE